MLQRHKNYKILIILHGFCILNLTEKLIICVSNTVILFGLVTSLCVSFTLQFKAICKRLHVMSNKDKEKVNFTLEQATKAQKGNRGVALPFL